MRRRVTVGVRLSVCVLVTSHFWRPERLLVLKMLYVLSGQRRCGVFFENAPFKSYGVKRKQKSQLLIRSTYLRSGFPIRCTTKHQRLLHERVQACVLLPSYGLSLQSFNSTCAFQHLRIAHARYIRRGFRYSFEFW